MVNVVFFSNYGRNTERFVRKLGLDCKVQQIPVKGDFNETITDPFILITPTYTDRGVPPQVMKFLNEFRNRKHLVGVVAGGNKNFGPNYAKAGKVISKKCKVPMLYAFEIMGTEEDVMKVREGIKNYAK